MFCSCEHIVPVVAMVTPMDVFCYGYCISVYGPILNMRTRLLCYMPMLTIIICIFKFVFRGTFFFSTMVENYDDNEKL